MHVWSKAVLLSISVLYKIAVTPGIKCSHPLVWRDRDKALSALRVLPSGLSRDQYGSIQTFSWTSWIECALEYGDTGFWPRGAYDHAENVFKFMHDPIVMDISNSKQKRPQESLAGM